MRTDELIDYQRCPVCKDTLAECKCPECQCCGETGNPQCGINRIATLEARVRELEGERDQLRKWLAEDEKRVELWSSGKRMADEEVEPLLGWLQETGGIKSCTIALELCRARAMEEKYWKETEDFHALLEMQRRAEKRGIERWRAERATERELMLPDKGDFITWLLHENDKLTEALSPATATGAAGVENNVNKETE